MVNFSKRKQSLTIFMFFILIIGLFSLIIQPITFSASNPSYVDLARPLPVNDLGPTAPLVLRPGECFTVSLRDNYDIDHAYIWTVEQEDMRILNYTVTVEKQYHNKIRICMPGSIIDGLYDLELVSSTGRYSVPRSIWITGRTLGMIRIVAMSDLHFGTGPDKTYNGDVNRYSAAIIASSLNPTFIIWSGDITDHATESEAQLAQSYRYILLYKYPVLGVAGNHDYPSTNYERYLGPTRWVRVICDKLVVIGVYTVPYISENNIITWSEIEFMEEALKNYSYVPYKIIVMHYPMFYYQGELFTRYDDEELLKPYTRGVTTPVSSYWSGNMSAFRYVLKLIEDYNVTAVIAGHIHVDQYVRYTSTRTNTTTYFITITTAAHGSATYQGITSFDLNLENGEITFPITPPGFIGFNNSTRRSASNSIPVSIVRTKLIRTPICYGLTIENTSSWYTINTTSIIALPWSNQLKTFQVQSDLRGAEIKVLNTTLVNNILFTRIKLITPPGSGGTTSISGYSDEKPPLIELTGRKYYPSIPTLNRSLSVYVKISDDVCGLDFDNIVVKFNGTSITVNYSPETLVSNMNEVYLLITLMSRETSKVLTVLEIYARDNCGKYSTVKYGIMFYPFSETPVEEPVYEIREAPTLTATQTQTVTTASTIRTEITGTITSTIVSEEETTTSTTVLHITTPQDTRTTITDYSSIASSVTISTTPKLIEGSSVTWIIIVISIIVITLLLYMLLKKK